jgi:hypothetical protein
MRGATPASPEKPRLDRGAAHESEVGRGLADVLETGNDFFTAHDVPGQVGRIGGLDAEIGFPMGRYRTSPESQSMRARMQAHRIAEPPH